MSKPAFEQLDAFGGPPVVLSRRAKPIAKPIRRVLSAPPELIAPAGLPRAQFVRRVFKEYYDAMRSAAAYASKAKQPTMSPVESTELRERYAMQRARAERAILLLMQHVVYPRVP